MNTKLTLEHFGGYIQIILQIKDLPRHILITPFSVEKLQVDKLKQKTKNKNKKTGKR